MQILDLLPGTYGVTKLSSDVTTLLGGEVEEDVKATGLQVFEESLREDQMWLEVGQRMTIAREERKMGPWWRLMCPQGGKWDMRLKRWKSQGAEVDLLEEHTFEDGKVRQDLWWKGVGEEVWRKLQMDTLTLDADKALVWEREWYLGEVVASLVVRTKRLEV